MYQNMSCSSLCSSYQQLACYNILNVLFRLENVNLYGSLVFSIGINNIFIVQCGMAIATKIVKNMNTIKIVIIILILVYTFLYAQS